MEKLVERRQAARDHDREQLTCLFPFTAPVGEQGLAEQRLRALPPAGAGEHLRALAFVSAPWCGVRLGKLAPWRPLQIDARVSRHRSPIAHLQPRTFT